LHTLSHMFFVKARIESF